MPLALAPGRPWGSAGHPRRSEGAWGCPGPVAPPSGSRGPAAAGATPYGCSTTALNTILYGRYTGGLYRSDLKRFDDADEYSKGQAGGVPLFSENRHVRRIYRLAVQSVAKMGIQGGFTGLQGHFYWGLLYKDLQNLASRSVAKNTL